jgi:hypothetical protein
VRAPAAPRRSESSEIRIQKHAPIITRVVFFFFLGGRTGV